MIIFVRNETHCKTDLDKSEHNSPHWTTGNFFKEIITKSNVDVEKRKEKSYKNIISMFAHRHNDATLFKRLNIIFMI